jgi:hypothetical protein
MFLMSTFYRIPQFPGRTWNITLRKKSATKFGKRILAKAVSTVKGELVAIPHG